MNGIIIQWGETTYVSATNPYYYCNFHTPFTSSNSYKLFGVTDSYIGDYNAFTFSGCSYSETTVAPYTTTYAIACVREIGTSAITKTKRGSWWFAIGY